jgi:hypothetical protein
MRVINIVRNVIAGNYRALFGVGSMLKSRRDAPPPLFIERFTNQTDFQNHRARTNEEIAARRRCERKLASSEPQLKRQDFVLSVSAGRNL